MNQGTKSVKRSCRFFLLDYIINFRVTNHPLLHISKTQTHFWLEYHWKQQSPKTPHSVRGAFEIRVLWVLLKRLGRWRCYGWVPPKSFQYDFWAEFVKIYLNISVTKLTQNFVKLHKKRNRCAQKLGWIANIDQGLKKSKQIKN